MDVNKVLLEKYYGGHCNEMEKQVVEEWLILPDGFTGKVYASDNHDAKDRMWRVIRGHIRENRVRQWLAVAAGLLLLFTTGGILWNRFNSLPPGNAYVVIDNTRNNLLRPQRVGNILLSESANSALRHVTGNKDCLLYTNSLVINNQQGDDIWVYLKTSSGKGSEMIKFLCRKKSTYVAGYITEHSINGTRKYLYSRQSAMLSEDAAASINSQLNAAKINARYKGYTAIII